MATATARTWSFALKLTAICAAAIAVVVAALLLVAR
jgi:hypothetical protein